MNTRSELTLKKLRESKQCSTPESSPKIPRLTSDDKAFIRELIKESENITSQVIKKSIKESEEKHFNFINSLIKESETRILSVIEDKVNNIQVQVNNITERVNDLETKSLRVDKMKEELIDIKKKILRQENSVVAGGIRISGVPYYENEDLNKIFNNICSSVQITTPKIESIYRLKKIYKNNKPYKPNDEVIAVKLQSPLEKNFVLKSISKYRRDNKTTMCLRNAGFDSNQPIYINENLTPHNHQIFKAALRLKKDKKILSAYTMRGLVYVRKHDTIDPILIEFIEEMDRLFR